MGAQVAQVAAGAGGTMRLVTSSDRTFGDALSGTSHLGYIPSGYVPLGASKCAIARRHPNEEVRRCEQEVVRIRHRPNTTRDGPVSGRVRLRWLTVTFAGGFSGLPRLVGLRGVVHHTRGNGGHRACHQQVPTGRSVGQCRRSHATANDP